MYCTDWISVYKINTKLQHLQNELAEISNIEFKQAKDLNLETPDDSAKADSQHNNSLKSNCNMNSSKESVESTGEFELIEKDAMDSNIDPWLTEMTASTCSQYNDTISQIEQPSAMEESLLSLTTTPAVTRKAKPNHGILVAEKNIGTSSVMSGDDLSCSSISNMENVQPPTVMDDVESSTLSETYVSSNEPKSSH